MPTNFYRAHVETRHFLFEAWGSSKEQAIQSLRFGLERHIRQTSAQMTWDELAEEVETTEFTLGICYRNREAF